MSVNQRWNRLKDTQSLPRKPTNSRFSTHGAFVFRSATALNQGLSEPERFIF